MFLLRLLLGLPLALAGLVVIFIGVAFLATLILIPLGLGCLSAGCTMFVLGLNIAAGSA